LQSVDDLKNGGLPSTIAADQRNPSPRRQPKRNVVKKRPSPMTLG